MVLTKRPRRMLGWFRWIDSERHDYAPSSGVTVSVVAAQHILEIGSDRLSAPRVPWALPNVWLGVSAENQQAADERIPLLFRCPATVHWVSVEPCLSRVDLRPHLDRLGGPDRLDWIVCGSESETDIDWMRDLRDQCVEAGVPFFLKQRHRDGKKISMPELDGRVWDGMP